MKLAIMTFNECIDSEYSEGEYGDWWENHSFRIDDEARIVTDENASDLNRTSEIFNVPFEAQPKELVYAVVLKYTTGDSFGYSSGNGEVMWVFKEETLARELVGKIERSKGFSIRFKVESGETVTIQNPAYGYFESIDNVYVRTLSVEV